jgi:hypothetical protein
VAEVPLREHKENDKQRERGTMEREHFSSYLPEQNLTRRLPVRQRSPRPH